MGNMKDILHDLSTPNLVSAIERNLFGLMRAVGAWPGAELHDDEQMLWCMTEIAYPLFNSILRARLPEAAAPAAIEKMTELARLRKVPLLWWTGPATQPPDLATYLTRQGFTGDDPMPGMALDLQTLTAAPFMPQGLTVERARDHATLKLWSEVCARGFEMPDFVAEGLYSLMIHADAETMRAYTGWLDGEPAATSLLVLAAGVAGMYNITTLPAARKKGIGATMTTLPLLEARALGYRAGILHASAMGASLYHSLGFREYCKIGQYVWWPAG